MKVLVSFRVPTDSAARCVSAIRAVEPDNADAPPGISISMRCDGSIIVAEITCLESYLLTCRNTVDDLLQHLFTALRTSRIINHAFKSGHEA